MEHNTGCRGRVPKDGHECDACVDCRGKGYPTDHGATDRVIDVKQENDETCEEDEERKMNHGRQHLNGTGNVKSFDSISEERTNLRSLFWLTP